MKRCYLVVLFVAVIVIANVLYAFYYPPRMHVVEQKIVLGNEKPGYASLRLSASYHIQVYRRGELIATRHKENDPITIQWYRLVADMMFGFIRDGAVNWLDTGGNQRTWVDMEAGTNDANTKTNPVIYIGLGSGTGTPSRNDYKLFNEVLKDIASVSFVDDSSNSQYIVTITKTFTITSSFNLSEVGLLLKVDVNTDDDYVSWVYVLIAHDAVSPVIDLVDGDSVAVTYTITIPYDVNGPFTRWFYNAIVNYFLGYRGTSGNLLTLKAESSNAGGLDTAGDNSGGDTIVGEYTFVEIGDSSSGVNPLFETYALGNMLQRIRIDNQQFLNEINEIDTYTIHYVVSFSFTSDATISEIGVSYYTDRDTGNSYAGGYYLWLYWNLASPINVNVGDGLRIEITIEIPYT